MKLKIRYFLDGIYQTQVLSSDTSIDEIVQVIKKLNDKNSIFIHIWHDAPNMERSISIIGGNLTRRLVIARNLKNERGEPVDARLMDTTIEDKTAFVDFALEDSNGIQLNLLRATVSVERAISVVGFTLRNGVIPNDTLWEMPNASWEPYYRG